MWCAWPQPSLSTSPLNPRSGPWWDEGQCSREFSEAAGIYCTAACSIARHDGCLRDDRRPSVRTPCGLPATRARSTRVRRTSITQKGLARLGELAQRLVADGVLDWLDSNESTSKKTILSLYADKVHLTQRLCISLIHASSINWLIWISWSVLCRILFLWFRFGWLDQLDSAALCRRPRKEVGTIPALNAVAEDCSRVNFYKLSVAVQKDMLYLSQISEFFLTLQYWRYRDWMNVSDAGEIFKDAAVVKAEDPIEQARDGYVTWLRAYRIATATALNWASINNIMSCTTTRSTS